LPHPIPAAKKPSTTKNKRNEIRITPYHTIAAQAKKIASSLRSLKTPLPANHTPQVVNITVYLKKKEIKKEKKKEMKRKKEETSPDITHLQVAGQLAFHLPHVAYFWTKISNLARKRERRKICYFVEKTNKH